MIEKKEIFLNNKDNNNYYDYNKRDPKYSNSENCYLNEIYLLCNHYHPSVQRIAKFILENYNKEIVNYEGNPLLDFSLVNFLEKFVLKNPKIKKINKNENKKDNNNNENNLIENKLKNFINDDNENNNPNNIDNNNIEIGDDDFAFINKFNQVYPKITNSKNYLKKLKKKEKKNKEKNEDDLIDDFEDKNNIDEELEKYADKVIEDEYKKLDKNVDNEDDEDNLEEELGSFEEEEDDNNNNDENDDEEEDDNNDLFADANDYKNQIEKNMEKVEEDDDDDFINKKPKKKFKKK